MGNWTKEEELATAVKFYRRRIALGRPFFLAQNLTPDGVISQESIIRYFRTCMGTDQAALFGSAEEFEKSLRTALQ